MNKEERIRIIEKSAKQVGKPIVFAILIIIISFLPVFLLTGKEGKMFHPLAWTKTLVITCSMILTVTLVPVLMVYLMKGKMRSETKNPVNRFFARIYEPVLLWCLRWKKTIIGINLILFIAALFFFQKMGTEFMPPLNEGTILFMPVALPDVSNAEMKRILRVQDKIISEMPEVKNVLGKAGRINSATDNAPLNMIETIVLLKPKDKWRAGMTKPKLITELNKKLNIPGVTNGWTQPIINRINMLSTGISSDVGIKIFGQDLDTLADLANKIAGSLKGLPGVVDLYPEQVTGSKYLNIKIIKEKLGRFGLDVNQVNNIIETALGGKNVGKIIKGRKRFEINVRYAAKWRNSIQKIKRTLIQTANGPVPLSAVADISIEPGPFMINSDNAMLRSTVQFNIRGNDLGNTIEEAKKRLNKTLTLPNGYYLQWSGQFKNMQHAAKTLKIILPIVVILILIILYYTFHDIRDALNTFLAIPFALTGGIFMTYLWGENLSVAVAVGFIALFGIAVETGVVMMIYLEEAMRDMVEKHGNDINKDTLRHYVLQGAVKRLRPKLMTVFVVLLGLIPTLWSNGRGIELMLPITLPMIGGIVTSATSILLVMPVIFEWIKERELKKNGHIKLTMNK